MIPYIAVVLFPLVVGHFHKNKVEALQSRARKYNEKRTRWLWLLFAALPMFFLIAFRHQSIGADTGVYINHFNIIVDTPWSRLFNNTRMETGYLIFVKLIASFTDNALVYQIVCASIYLLSFTCFVNEVEDNHFMVLFLFGTLGMYTFMFTGVRQCLAISMCLLAFRFVKSRNIWMFALLMVIAFNFHHSSILFAAAYVLYPRKLSGVNFLLYALIVTFAVFNLDALQSWFGNQLGYEYEIEGGAGGVISAAIIIFMAIISILIMVYRDKNSRISTGVLNVGIIAAMFWGLRLFTRTAERPSFYFLPFLFAAFAQAINALNKKNEKIAVQMLFFLLAMTLFVYRMYSSTAGFLPYRFYSFSWRF